MSKFDDYVRIILDAIGWRIDRTVNKKDEPEPPLDFLNAVDEVAKKFGYEAKAWGEAEELGKRVVMFYKMGNNNTV